MEGRSSWAAALYSYLSYLDAFMALWEASFQSADKSRQRRPGQHRQQLTLLSSPRTQLLAHGLLPAPPPSWFYLIGALAKVSRICSSVTIPQPPPCGRFWEPFWRLGGDTKIIENEKY